MLLVFIAFSVFFVQISAESFEENENDEEIPTSEDNWLKEHKVEIFNVNFFQISVHVLISISFKTRNRLNNFSDFCIEVMLRIRKFPR